MPRMRLDRLLANLGYGTRSQVRDLLRAGYATVDGTPAKNAGMIVDPEAQEIYVSGKRAEWKENRTVMLFKPRGVLTAARDPRQRTVLDLLPPLYRASSCMPAGRLDKDTDGLLILTTDGQLAHQLISPAKDIEKVYEATVDGPLLEEDVYAFAEGLAINDADGTFTAKPARLRILTSGESESLAQVTVSEGKYHQVRRMFAARGRTVLTLRRLSIGGLSLDATFAPGDWRELSEMEIALLTTSFC